MEDFAEMLRERIRGGNLARVGFENWHVHISRHFSLSLFFFGFRFGIDKMTGVPF